LTDPVFDEFHEHLDEMRQDATVFVRDILGVEPTEQQAAVLKAISQPGAKVTVKSGHGTGKSTIMAWEVLRTVALFPGCKVPCTAPTAHQLEDVLWPEIAKWHERMTPWFRDQIIVDSKRVYLKDRRDQQFAVARTARKERPEALQGFHADHLLFLVDEASGVPDPVFHVAQGALSTPDARVLMCANPTMNTGYFFQSHHRMRDRWTRFTLSCKDSPLVAQEYIEDVLQAYGGEDSDVYRVRVLGEFPNSAICQLISRPLAEEAASRKLHPTQYQWAPVIIGVDPAWEGDDRTVAFKRQGLATEILGVWHQIDNMTLGGVLHQMWGEHNADAMFIDLGWGAGIIDYLRSVGRDPIPVNFGGTSISNEYSNKRTEMWCEMKKWLDEGGHIPDEQDLIEDLVGPEFSFLPNGKKTLERKKDMKKRGLPSPDLGDALALTFASPVIKPAPMQINRLINRQDQREFCRMDYKPF
jgi:hypothetical protein